MTTATEHYHNLKKCYPTGYLWEDIFISPETLDSIYFDETTGIRYYNCAGDYLISRDDDSPDLDPVSEIPPHIKDKLDRGYKILEDNLSNDWDP